ncbi:MAG: hypothetical protein ABR592_06145 [Nitriliruptorales bacterium]
MAIVVITFYDHFSAHALRSAPDVTSGWRTLATKCRQPSPHRSRCISGRPAFEPDRSDQHPTR